MLTHLRRGVLATVVFAALSFVYALAGTGLSQVLFPHQANGSITPSGSTLIGQNWTSTRFFHGRPDDFGPYAATASSPGGDNPLVANGHHGSSGATNLGPRSALLVADTRALVAWWHAHGVDPTPDLVTTSGSGYDPDITPADARAEIPMLTASTGLPASRLRALIARYTIGPQLGFLGAAYVDVLTLNEALARLEGR
jgi:K+-transporting ATPase ATPase C chain